MKRPIISRTTASVGQSIPERDLSWPAYFGRLTAVGLIAYGVATGLIELFAFITGSST